MKKQPKEFQRGDPIVILDGFQSIPRQCKVVSVTQGGGIIGETSKTTRFFAPGPDRYIVEDLFNKRMPWES